MRMLFSSFGLLVLFMTASATPSLLGVFGENWNEILFCDSFLSSFFFRLVLLWIIVGLSDVN